MGLKVAGRGDTVEASWEGMEALGEGAVLWIVVLTLLLVLVVSSVVGVIDTAKEAVPGLEEEEITGPVETEDAALCVVARVVLIEVIRIGAEREEAPQEGYGHQLKDEDV
jgi:succinate dehydrogenase/fumarate reductase cytochrome b subunit